MKYKIITNELLTLFCRNKRIYVYIYIYLARMLQITLIYILVLTNAEDEVSKIIIFLKLNVSTDF